MPRRAIVAGVVAGALALAAAAGAQGGGAAAPDAHGVGVAFAGVVEARWLESNAKQLGISDDTLAAIRKIADEAHAAASRQMEGLRAAGRKLGEELDKELPDPAALDRAVEATGKLWTSSLKERMRTSVKLRQLLTKEQRKQAAELRSKAPGAGQPEPAR